MNIKKIIAAVSATAVTLSAMAVTASADSIGSASIYLADETWSSQVYWGNGVDGKDTIGIAAVNPAEITGDGTYTTSVEFEKAMNYGFIFCLSSDIKGTGSGSFADYPDAEMCITSVKADGKEISGNESIADVNDNGFMKINIFDPLIDAGENYVDSLEWTSGIKSMEVTFTVMGTGILSAEAEPEDEQEQDPSDTTLPPEESSSADDGGSDATTDDSDGGQLPAGDSPADMPVGGEAENVPADDSTEAPDTGNTSMAAIVALISVSAAAAIVSGKRR